MVRVAAVEFESALETLARDFDAKAFVDHSSEFQELKVRLKGRGLTDRQAQNLSERLVRAFFTNVSEDIATPFQDTLARLISVQKRVMGLYNTARQTGRLPRNFAEDMRDLLRQKERYFEDLRRLQREHPEDPQDMPHTTLESVIGGEDANRPASDEHMEAPGTTETDEPLDIPHVTKATEPDLDRAVANLRRRTRMRPDIEVGWGRQKGTTFSRRAQVEGFASEDQAVAGRGAEATFKLPGEPKAISVDGILWTGNRATVFRNGQPVEVGTFRLGEFKAADPAEGAQSIYTDLDVGTDIEGGFRDQLARLMNLCQEIGTACEGITYRTNTAQSVEALTMLIDSIIPRGQRDPNLIRIEGPM